MFFETCRDTSEVLDLVKEAFDVVAFLVEDLGEAMANLAVDLVRNVRCRALILDPVSDPIRVVSLVAENDVSVGEVGQQHRRAVGVMGLAGGQRQFDWKPPRIGEGMDLGGQSSSRAAHTMNSVVFFTLAAC